MRELYTAVLYQGRGSGRGLLCSRKVLLIHTKAAVVVHYCNYRELRYRAALWLMSVLVINLVRAPPAGAGCQSCGESWFTLQTFCLSRFFIPIFLFFWAIRVTSHKGIRAVSLRFFRTIKMLLSRLHSHPTVPTSSVGLYILALTATGKKHKKSLWPDSNPKLRVTGPFVGVTS